MIQTDVCEVCGGGIYRDVDASWSGEAWHHMYTDEFTHHRAQPKMRSIDDDDDATRTAGR